eukprot:1152999-Pelagomonas_calceolata.AAC.6
MKYRTDTLYTQRRHGAFPTFRRLFMEGALFAMTWTTLTQCGPHTPQVYKLNSERDAHQQTP